MAGIVRHACPDLSKMLLAMLPVSFVTKVPIFPLQRLQHVTIVRKTTRLLRPDPHKKANVFAMSDTLH
jgi:hypothetical protein